MTGRWGGDEEQRKQRGGGERGMNVGQTPQLPVSNQSREEGTEEKVGGRQRKECFTPVWSAVNGTRAILMKAAGWEGWDGMEG